MNRSGDKIKAIASAGAADMDLYSTAPHCCTPATSSVDGGNRETEVSFARPSARDSATCNPYPVGV
jgi:hypothetical protein